MSGAGGMAGPVRRGLALCATAIFLTLLTLQQNSSGDGPPPLPDIYLSDDDITITTLWGDSAPECILPDYLHVCATVHNRGPGEASSVNVSIYVDGRLVCILPLAGTLAADEPFNSGHVEYIWDATSLSFGEHTLRVEAGAPCGDANPGDNGASRGLMVGWAPALLIRTDETTRTANSTPDGGEIVRFTGSVSVYDDSGGPVEVTLDASTDRGWDADILPRNMVFTNSSPQAFVATVLVPPGAGEPGITTLTINGMAFNGYFLDLASTMASIVIQPYCCFTVEPVRDWYPVGPGGVAGLEIAVTNTGNSIDSFRISIENQKELGRRGWEFIMERTTLARLSPGSKSSATLYIRAPAAGGGRAEIRLNVSSLNAENMHSPVSEVRTVTVEARKGEPQPVITLENAAAVLLLVFWVAVVVDLLRWRKRLGPAPSGSGREGHGNNI
ncbi:MAG: choice-of-anchor T family protein [Thermoplasmata archaeon]